MPTGSSPQPTHSQPSFVPSLVFSRHKCTHFIDIGPLKVYKESLGPARGCRGENIDPPAWTSRGGGPLAAETPPPLSSDSGHPRGSPSSMLPFDVYIIAPERCRCQLWQVRRGGTRRVTRRETPVIGPRNYRTKALINVTGSGAGEAQGPGGPPWGGGSARRH